MSPDSPSNKELIAYLRAQIKERQERGNEIERSIKILEEAEHELQRQLDAIYPALKDETEDIPYRIAKAPEGPEARDIKVGAPPEREAAFSLDDDAGAPQPAASPAASAIETDLEGALQEGQHLLLDRKRKRARRGAPSGKEPRNGKHIKNIAPPEIVSDLDLDEDVSVLFKNPRRRPTATLLTADAGEVDFPGIETLPSQEKARKKTARPAKTAVESLKKYIREGGAIRCLDPWNRTCAAFVLRQGDGPSIFATDAFLTYLRRAAGQLTPPGEAAAGDSKNVEKQKDFLGNLMGALMQENFEAVKQVPSLQVSAAKTLPPKFEFETASITIMHTRVLAYLHALFQKPMDAFFAAGGPYSEIQEYLDQYREFTLERSEEARTAALLRQAGIPFSTEGGDVSPGIDPDAMSSYSASFVEEGENLQDLNTFDYTPEDQKVILSQKETALSSSMFKKLGPENPFLGKPQPGEEGGKNLSAAGRAHATPPEAAAEEKEDRKKDEKAEDMEQMLKDLGIDWKD